MPDNNRIHLSSENFAGAHPLVMNALNEANAGNTPSYGRDPYTEETIALFKMHFGEEIEVYFTFNGTGANNFGLGAVTERYHSIFVSDVSHLYVDESTAPETFIGCRIYPIHTRNGKMDPRDLADKIKRVADVHHPQPRVVSVTQPTEYGTVYTPDEMKAIKEVCQRNGLLFHVDGARFFNAAAHLEVSLKQLSADCGVDILTLGGTKSGMLFGEAVIFFNPPVNNAYRYHLKRSMQLASKNRFLAVQFQALLKDGLWKKIAGHTNSLARHFETSLATVPDVQVIYPVESNAVFVSMPEYLYDRLQDYASFYYWNVVKNEYRFIFSFNNATAEIPFLIDKMRM